MLKNKTILITGASSGIGEATAVQLAKQGAKLILCARRRERLEALQQQLEQKYNIKVEILVLDVRDKVTVKAAAAQLPAVDILINNAGCALGRDNITEASLEDWEEMLDSNVKGMLYWIHALLPRMLDQKHGHIVNIGSTAALNVYMGGSVYCASKHAVHALTKTLGLEVAGTPIRVTEIDPGMVETEFSLVRFKQDVTKAKNVYANMTPLSAQDVADAILYAITRPQHVNIGQMVLYATEQVQGRPS